MTLSELTDRMSPSEFEMWHAYDRECGLPDMRAEVYAAQQAAVTINPHLKKESRKAVQDFMLFDRREKAVEEVDVLNVLREKNANS